LCCAYSSCFNPSSSYICVPAASTTPAHPSAALLLLLLLLLPCVVLAVFAYSLKDLLHLITAGQQLHTRLAAQNPFLRQGWSVAAAACTVSLQMLLLLAVRATVSALITMGALALLQQLMRGVQATAVLMHMPTLQGLAIAMRILSGWAGAAPPLAEVAAAAAEHAAQARAAATAAAPWHAYLLAMHHLFEDLGIITCARLVWETQEFVFKQWWEILGLAASEAHAFFASAAAAAALLLSGASRATAWGRFLQLHPLFRHRMRDNRLGVREDQRVQAQVFIQAPADMGQAAEALRTLADELEQLGVNAPLGGTSGGAVARRRVRQLLGQHWPAPLVLPFEAEQLQAELGLEVPRGFVCPITQDIMRLPALLISSSVAVPATYDRDAISRWLENNRCAGIWMRILSGVGCCVASGA
jgi:hypothetical protein